VPAGETYIVKVTLDNYKEESVEVTSAGED